MSAFGELVTSRGYEPVSIRDVIDRANVGRSTFYSHYRSKEALLKESLKRPSYRLAASVRPDATPQMLMPLLEHFRAQRSVNAVFFRHPIRSLWVRSLAAMIDRHLPPASATNRTRSPLPRSLVALTLAEAQIALITHWLVENPRVPSGTIAEVLLLHTRAMI